MAQARTKDRSTPQNATAKSTKEAAKEETKQAIEQPAEKAKEEVKASTQQAKGKIQEQVSSASTTASEQMKVTAEGLRSLSKDLREKDQSTPAGWIEQAADKAEQLGSYLEEADAKRLMRDLEDFGRRNPGALALGGLAAGFAIARFVKASSPSESEGGSSRPDEGTS